MKKETTKLRLFLMMFAVIAVSACSSTDDAENADMMGDKEMLTGSTGIDVMDNTPSQGAPGSQQDLQQTVGDRVFFGYDQYNLSDEARSTLSMQAEWMNQYPNVNIVVEGHADERGTREYNLALGERRAASVKNYLIASGVSPSRIDHVSYGKERPAVGGSDPSAWAQNRRGVTTVQ